MRSGRLGGTAFRGSWRNPYPEITGKYCFKCSFNLTFRHESQGKPVWTSLYHYAINLESSLGPALATDAALPLRRHGLAAGGIRERLAMRRQRGSVHEQGDDLGMKGMREKRGISEKHRNDC